MALFPERGQSPKETIQERPEELNLPEQFAKETGAKSIESAFKANVQDHGKPLIQTPANQTVTITIPSTQGNLVAWSKGSITNSITWLARFWLRIIKKAVHFGWRIIWGGQNAVK